MIRLEAATVLLQWAAGGMLFTWVTTRRREVGLGYGWLMRGVFGALAAGAAYVGFASDPVAGRDFGAVAVAILSGIGLVVSIARKSVGVSKGREADRARSERVAAMTGIEREAPVAAGDGPEFPPVLDLLPAAAGFVGLVLAGLAVEGNEALAVARNVVGAAFLGAVTDAMLLGHWYLVQPGMSRAPLHELVDWAARIWPVEVALLLVPTGMVSALNGSIDDGYGGLLGWFWLACAATTIVLCFVTKAALRERAYSAVMAATGLLYLAILTAFGTDLVARAVLAG